MGSTLYSLQCCKRISRASAVRVSNPLIISAIDSCSITIHKHLQYLEESVNIAYEIKQDSTITSMAMQGLGAAIMPRLAAEPVPEQLKVYSLPVPLERIIKAAVVKNALHTPAVFAFLESLKNHQHNHLLAS